MNKENIMVLNTFMNFIESVAIPKPIDFYHNNEFIATIEMNEHDDRYWAFMSEFGLYSVNSLDIDTNSASYVVNL